MPSESATVYQSIQLALNTADVEIAGLRGELGDHQQKVSELRRMVDTMPQVEAEFARLNRDYAVNKAQYTALVDRLEKARLGGEADATGSVRFEIIDVLLRYMQLCPVPTRPTARQIVLHEGCFKEKSHHKKQGPQGFPKLDSQAYDVRGAMFYRCMIDRRESLFVFSGITALSLCRRFNLPVQLHFFNFLRESS